jgi:6-phosphogluconolactonase
MFAKFFNIDRRWTALAAVMGWTMIWTSGAMAQNPPRTRAAAEGPKASPRCSQCQCPINSGTFCESCAAGKTRTVSTKPASRPTAVGDRKSMAMPMTGNVYTLDNDATNNGLAVYHRRADGSLVPAAASPISLRGRGLSGGDIDEQGAIRVHGEFILAVNPGSDTVAVLRKTAFGLSHVPGSPFPSGGSTPLSLTAHGDLVYVANQAAPFANPKSEPNVTGFRLTEAGQLVPLPRLMVTFPKGQGPAQVEFSPHGKTLVVTGGFQADGASRLYSFRVLADGRLQAGANSPIEPQGATGTVGFSWSPAGDQVYASLFKGSAVIAFHVDPATAAIHQMSKPAGDDQQAACWTAISRDGRALYVGNFVSNSISVYDVAAGGKLTLLGSVPRRGASSKDTKDIEISKDGKYLYAVGSGMRQISVFRIESNRLLTELPVGQSPIALASGQNITGLAVE